MALSKKKRPKREDKQLDGSIKVEAEVFDRKSLISLSTLIEGKFFDTVEGLISRGKEANVFLAKKKDEYFAVKIYRVETGAFTHIHSYIDGDKRFEGAANSRMQIAMTFARKEYGNLKLAQKGKVRVPIPVKFRRNILITKFLGENGLRYPKLFEIGSEKPEADLQSLLFEIKKLYKAGLVHSDLSEYNVLMTEDGPYLIDFAQAVPLSHPAARAFLERDVRNILHYFEKKYKIRKEKEEVLEWIKGD